MLEKAIKKGFKLEERYRNKLKNTYFKLKVLLILSLVFRRKLNPEIISNKFDKNSHYFKNYIKDKSSKTFIFQKKLSELFNDSNKSQNYKYTEG